MSARTAKLSRSGSEWELLTPRYWGWKYSVWYFSRRHLAMEFAARRGIRIEEVR